MTQFLGVMLDPFVDGRLGGFGTAGSSAIGFAPEQQDNLPPDIALAYASILTKAPPAPSFEGRWTAWLRVRRRQQYQRQCGGRSNNVTTSTFGFAGGMDYHLSPGVTPYGAVQFQDFHTPAYSESAAMGGAFGLAYNAMNATDVRTELGSRIDAPMVVGGMPLSCAAGSPGRMILSPTQR